VDGTQIIRICVNPIPFGPRIAMRAAVAADTGLAVTACCEAIVATAIGRSGRTRPFMATS